MNTLEATTQLDGFNQRLLMRKSNKRLPSSRPHQHKDDAIDTFFSSVKDHDGNTNFELTVCTKTIFLDVYVIGSKSGLNIAKFLQDRFCESSIPINIWSNNAQECAKTYTCLWSR